MADHQPPAQPSVDPAETTAPIASGQHNGVQGAGQGPQIISTSGQVDVLCGPLINYKHMSGTGTANPTWHGSVLIVTKPGTPTPSLSLHCLGAVPGGIGASNTSDSSSGSRTYEGVKLYEDPGKAFFRFVIDVPFQAYEAQWEYTIASLEPQIFMVPAISQSMRIMFHSCNGFSVGTDVDAWSGPALWNDVLRMHAQRPFHVMIGGGDQIYNDGVRVDGPLKPWTDIHNPRKRRDYPFTEKLREECDEYYFQNYIRWYGTAPFSTANGKIPQLNIWDDHDIIDGFGSYTDHFMKAPVFRGIGGVAHKYYLLFQHHVAPPKSTFTTDAPKTVKGDTEGVVGTDAVQLKDTFVLEETEEDPSYIIGGKPGPYVAEKSRSIYCQLGARIAFAGLDARIERTRHQINYPETYKMIFDTISRELSAAPDVKHLVLLLGVPIAYPRLQWLENILSSPVIAPIRLLNKRFGIAGGLFNKFDGNVDLLDDLDDHYTAHQHKHERKELIHRLQELSKQHSVRVSILGGDVHLAAIGRFFSNPKQQIPAERDYRYMPNIISSAITNKPPPQAVANLLARRNKIHHLDHETDETLLEIFDRDPGRADHANGDAPAKKTADANNATMPSRNYAIIDESHEPGQLAASTLAPADGTVAPATNGATADVSNTLEKKANTRHAIHNGEKDAGTKHPAASGLHRTGLCGTYGLDVTLRVEISPKDREGKTEGYGFSVPALDAKGHAQQGTHW
ncbi:hypothetical protein EJ05DRAFT_480710 [Pseudovirgaria hyperparasitica]|uniref:PhoD-like phosphatase domain-containing protein n=1 Tax=Pseudovirgaria hyperparasitica TaxID=470096 RepID=A0A6A6VUR2_9PEZI|nr:uncharacterized protein EJ05DRAFT_480710 [Pseudovirgaria hyperparasitica]KAF2752997.1 hypothetical protein EJ05DRAFT_480710 [Pseudovirgaria hyperparasitica]